MTNAEKVVWHFLKGKQLGGYDFHRQKPIGNYIADFYCYKLRLVIKIDGISHEDEIVIQNDFEKDKYLNNIGFKVLRFKDEEVMGSGNKVEEAIIAIIKEIEHSSSV